MNFGMFTVYSRHPIVILGHLEHLKRNRIHVYNHSLFLPLALGNHRSTFSLCLFWTWRINKIPQFVVFSIQFISLSIFLRFTHVVHVLYIMHSFLLTNSIPVHGYSTFYLSKHRFLMQDIISFQCPIHSPTYLNCLVRNHAFGGRAS